MTCQLNVEVKKEEKENMMQYDCTTTNGKWGKTSVPDHGYVPLFDCDWPDSVDITNRWPFSIQVYASTETDDAFFQVCHGEVDTNFKVFSEGDDDDTTCSVGTCSGWDGHLRMDYVLLKDPMDSNIKITYVSHEDDDGKEEVVADIFAYYAATAISVSATSVSAVCQANDHGFGGLGGFSALDLYEYFEQLDLFLMVKHGCHV
ncbi:hypothetical protein Tco_0557349 [Tanacetum coccineum]